MASNLYISYDGLLDPLGASQILPYLRGIASVHPGMVVLSFEKADRLAKDGAAMATSLAAQGIQWKPLRFTRGLSVLGKAWDLAKMYFWGWRLGRQYQIRAVHARGHPSAQIGLFLKRYYGAKLIFDFRGLWVDERVDKGGWDLSRRFHRLQYQHFKRTERRVLANADQVVVLTHAVVSEVARLGATPPSKITVIPCCADFDHFTLASPRSRELARKDTGTPVDALVIGYLGSVGRMYMLDRFFRLFELAAAQREDVHALVITHDVEALKKVMGESLPTSLHARVRIKPATRNEVPQVIPAMDVLVSFTQPSYARMSMSPTKLAECFSVGIPAICNAGVGDVADLIQSLGAGVIVDSASDGELSGVVGRLDEICAMGGLRLRNAARAVLGLEVAAARYQAVYSRLN